MTYDEGGALDENILKGLVIVTILAMILFVVLVIFTGEGVKC